MVAVAAAAGLSGLLSYKPPTELRTATPAPVRARPVVTGAFTATPASVPGWPAPSPSPPTSTTAVPSVAPPVPEAPVATAPPPPADEPPAETPVYVVPVYVAPDWAYAAEVEDAEPEPEAEVEDRSAGPARNCDLYDGLLATLDDPALRTAISTVGC